MSINITIEFQTFATDLLNTVDNIVNSFVQTGYQNLVQNNQDVITLMMTLYVGWLAYRILSHSITMEIMILTKHLSLLVIVYALLNDWQLFYLFFYNIFTNEPATICQTMISSSGNFNFQGQSSAQALNEILVQGMTASKSLLSQAGRFEIPLFFYSIIVGGVTCLTCLYALALLIYAKIAIAIMLFIAPIFISFLLWDSTRRLFDNWIQALLNYSFIPIITCGILMLLFTIAQATLPGLMSNVNSGSPTFTGIFPYSFILIVGFILLRQVLSISAALSAGFALEGISAGVAIGKQILQSSGAIAVTKFAGRLVANSINPPPIRTESHKSEQSRKVKKQAARDI